MKERIMLAAVLILVASSSAHAFNLGSYVKHGYEYIQPGGIGSFSILLWADEDMPVRLLVDSIESPEGWRIEINPGTVEIDRKTGSENVIVSGKTIKATEVKILAYPAPVSNGAYKIKIRASAASSEGELPSSQERFFVLSAFVNNTNAVVPDIPIETTTTAIAVSTTFNLGTTTPVANQTTTTTVKLPHDAVANASVSQKPPLISGLLSMIKSASDSFMSFITWQWLSR